FNDTVSRFLQQMSPIGPAGYYALIVLLIALCLSFFYFGKPKYSRVVNPDALRLDPANPTHLIGRAEDLDRLYSLCTSTALVFVIGESGAGKSAILQGGIIPRLEKNPSYIP